MSTPRGACEEVVDRERKAQTCILLEFSRDPRLRLVGMGTGINFSIQRWRFCGINKCLLLVLCMMDIPPLGR